MAAKIQAVPRIRSAALRGSHTLCGESLRNRAAPRRARSVGFDRYEPARPEERPPVGLIVAALGDQGQESAAGILGPTGNLGDQGVTDPVTAVGVRAGHRQDPRLLPGMAVTLHGVRGGAHPKVPLMVGF
ncbi:hypothetical protein [Streptomyces inhibens]|uniref:hypothetical protein n=1 Tax=Streptomyces inhibens TaxID=2293571 RepID=UPI000FFBB508|nr:hypothetical protein [Streptomyces inhibens]